MKILFINSQNNGDYVNDYMNDLLLHGLRQISGHEVIDYPGAWYLYKDESIKRNLKKSSFWGKGFTTSNILNNFNSIDRTDILSKIRNNYFDLVVYGSIRRNNEFMDDVLKYNNHFIVVDGEDDQYIEKKYSNKCIYFKRELNQTIPNIESISFAVPKEKILKNIPKKFEYLLAPLIPGKLNTYNYDYEDSYYEMYEKSVFALTNKKIGWDCLRHYEILMNGCIPLFINLNDCPKRTMETLPKEKLNDIYKNYHQILSYYNPFRIYKKKFLSLNKFVSYFSNFLRNKNLESYMNKNLGLIDLKNELLTYTKNNLTTENLAKYVINKTFNKKI